MLLVIAFSSCENRKAVNYCELVDPLIGTDFHGHTYPGAAAPFGMVHLSPDSRIGMTWDGCSGYHYSDSVIYGFSHTHLSGTGCFDMCDILFMPTVGDVKISNDISNGTSDSYVSMFHHENEYAEAGYYSVLLDDYNIKVDLTPTASAGYHKYNYPKNADGNVIIDLTHQDFVIESILNIEGADVVTGMRRSKHWAEDQVLYFVAKFSRPFDGSGIYFNDELVGAKRAEGSNIKGFVSFSNITEPLYVTVGISAVSVENARRNMDEGLTFEKALATTQKAWNKELSKIEVESMNRNDAVVFYTALYHTMLSPQLFSDVNGEYLGRDKKVHTSENNFYHVFSLWDTYRALHPLHSIINQKRTNDFINTFLMQYKQGGALPVWELSANETFCMIGYHAVPVIYDAYMKGVRGYDLNLALEAMKNSAELDLFGQDGYRKDGFIAVENEHESVSKTLEYAYDDWCVAMMSKALGDDKGYEKYIKRAQNYKNIFDPTTGFHRAKAHNMWFTPFDPTEVNFNYTEANCWQYNFHVQQDVNTLIDIYGGDEAFGNKLDEMFNSSSEMGGRVQVDITGTIGQYAHGNEPSHHVAYLYNYVGTPYKTQKLVRQIMDDMYYNAPDGLCGNEDCGQMSAWYVFSALGFYPVCPGDNQLVLGSPKVVSAKINLENGKCFTIKTVNQSKANIYVERVEYNGYDYTKTYLTYLELLNGGELVFYMSNTPSKSYGYEISDRPVNVIKDNLISPVPYFTGESQVFKNSMDLGIASLDKNAEIYYTMNGMTPDRNSIKYDGNPYKLNLTTPIKAISYNKDGVASEVISTVFSRAPKNRSIKLMSKYESQYSGGGKNALVDNVRGGDNFKTGGWQGYQGQDIVAIVDLGSAQQIDKLGMGFLQDSRSWIFYPTEVIYYVSDDGKNFKEYGRVENKIDSKTENVTTQVLSVEGNSQSRYVKVVAKSLMVCPPWHLSAGCPSWLFADEIIIN